MGPCSLAHHRLKRRQCNRYGARQEPRRNVGRLERPQRRKAVLGWLAFVVVAYLVGGIVGQHNLTDAQMGNGPSGQGTTAFEKAFPYHTGEEVLLQGRGPAAPKRAVFVAAVTTSSPVSQTMKTVADIQSPLPVRGRGGEPGSALSQRAVDAGQLRGGGEQQPGPDERRRPARRRRGHGRVTTRNCGWRSSGRPAPPRR